MVAIRDGCFVFISWGYEYKQCCYHCAADHWSADHGNSPSCLCATVVGCMGRWGSACWAPARIGMLPPMTTEHCTEPSGCTGLVLGNGIGPLWHLNSCADTAYSLSKWLAAGAGREGKSGLPPRLGSWYWRMIQPVHGGGLVGQPGG